MHTANAYDVQEVILPFGRPLRVLELTEFHAGIYMTREEMRRYDDLVIALRPDLFVLTGVFISNSMVFPPGCVQKMARVRARYGTFATSGNHEHVWGRPNSDVRALTTELGCRVGIAVTAQMDPTSPEMDRPSIDPRKDVLRHIQAPTRGGSIEPVPVIVAIEAVGPRSHAKVVIGDSMALMLKAAGAVGLLTNGSIRDVEGMRAVPLAYWGGRLFAGAWVHSLAGCQRPSRHRPHDSAAWRRQPYPREKSLA